MPSTRAPTQKSVCRRPLRTRGLAAAVLCTLAALLLPEPAAAGGLAGRWRLNETLTAELQPPPPTSGAATSGFGRPTVVVGGMPVPLPGTTAPSPGLGGPSPDPMVVRCTELTVSPAGDELLLEYHGLGTERLRRGNVQGLKSRWSDRKLSTGYATTTRKVTQTWSVDRDDRLVVTVKLNPEHGRTVTHKRVFDRIDG